MPIPIKKETQSKICFSSPYCDDDDEPVGDGWLSVLIVNQRCSFKSLLKINLDDILEERKKQDQDEEQHSMINKKIVLSSDESPSLMNYWQENKECHQSYQY